MTRFKRVDFKLELQLCNSAQDQLEFEKKYLPYDKPIIFFLCINLQV